jgi:hypothetical protein
LHGGSRAIIKRQWEESIKRAHDQHRPILFRDRAPVKITTGEKLSVPGLMILTIMARSSPVGAAVSDFRSPLAHLKLGSGKFFSERVLKNTISASRAE